MAPDPHDQLDDLGERIDALKDEHAPPKDDGPGAHQGAGMGMRMGVEFVAGVLVGGLIGWHLDKWLATTPFFFILCLLLGAAGGGLTMYRLSQRLDD